MKDKYFLDTNILVYSFDHSSPAKQDRAIQLINDALVYGTGIISYQVIQEFINVALKKFKTPLTLKELKQYLHCVLIPLCEHYGNSDLFDNALEIQDNSKYSFYDSLIITAALESHCSILYSEDLHHQQHLQSLQIINPF